jgi:hypothetical protein
VISIFVFLAGRPVEASPQAQTSSCDLYVDSRAASGGNGSAARPWNTIPSVVVLAPGQDLCLRGDTSGAGRVYSTGPITLQSDGTAAEPLALRAYPGERVIVRDNGSQGPLIEITGDHWLVEELIIDNGGNGNAALVVAVSAAYSTVRHNEIRNGRYNGVELRGTHTGLVDNHIHHFDGVDRDAECVIVFNRADHLVISQNTVHDCSGNNVEFYQPDGELVDRNVLSNNVLIDGNVFYRGAITRAEAGIGFKQGAHITITNNDVSGFRDQSPSINVHRLVYDVLIEGNRIHDAESGINIHRDDGQTPEDVTVRNNWIYNINHPQWGYGIQVVGVQGATITHNTLFNISWRSILVARYGIDGGGLVAGNLVYNSGRAEIESDTVFRNVTVTHNGWFSTQTNLTSTGDTVGSGDPGFRDAAQADFHLLASSGVRDRGQDVGVRTDFDGDARLVGCQPDLGADEYIRALSAGADLAPGLDDHNLVPGGAFFLPLVVNTAGTCDGN